MALGPTQLSVHWAPFRLPLSKTGGHGVNQSSDESEERVELYLYFTSGSSWIVLEQTLLFTFSRL